MDDLMTMVGQVGFPIAVAAYVLIRMEATLKDNTKAINNLTAKIGGMNDGTGNGN